jgi:hypothetical protein
MLMTCFMLLKSKAKKILFNYLIINEIKFIQPEMGEGF